MGIYDTIKSNPAMQFGLMSAGAAMMDPRGTGGSIGASVNKSMQAGLGTAIPLMQWQQNKKDRKEDRNWNKEQDMIRNVLQERQFKMRQEALEGEAENRSERTNIARAQFGLAKQKMDQDLMLLEQKNQAMSNYYGAVSGGVANPAYKPGFKSAVGQPEKLTATPQQIMQYGAQAIQGGADPQAVKMMNEAYLPKDDPSSPGFKSSVFNAKIIEDEAKRLVSTKQAKDMEEARFIARKNLTPNMLMDRQFAQSMDLSKIP